MYEDHTNVNPVGTGTSTGFVADCAPMKRLLTLVLLVAAAFIAVPTAPAQAIPLCVRYVDPIHMGSYDYCPLGK
jgi:hypothetical protein